MKNLGTILLALLVVLVLLSLSAFTVDQREYALVFRFGKIVAVKKDPGLYFKAPLIDGVMYFEKRIVTLDWEQPAEITTSEKKTMTVDSFVKWRIIDPAKFYVSTTGTADPEKTAEGRLSIVVNEGIRDEFGKRTVHDVIAGERGKIMESMKIRADKKARQIGIEVVDVRLKRVDYSEQISNSVYERMISERKRIATQLRNEGAAASEKIRADADKQREVIIAEAYNKAQKIKGEGDAKAAEIYSEAYGKNPEFYAFYRSQEAYKNSFKSKSDVMVLDPNSDFFKYMRGPGAKK
jgi:modulator of FtsH protease HflC